MTVDGRLTVHSGRDGRAIWTQRVFAHETSLHVREDTTCLVAAGQGTLILFRLPGTEPARVLARPEGWVSILSSAGDVDGDGIDDMLLGNGFGLAQVRLSPRATCAPTSREVPP